MIYIITLTHRYFLFKNYFHFGSVLAGSRGGHLLSGTIEGPTEVTLTNVADLPLALLTKGSFEVADEHQGDNKQGSRGTEKAQSRGLSEWFVSGEEVKGIRNSYKQCAAWLLATPEAGGSLHMKRLEETGTTQGRELRSWDRQHQAVVDLKVWLSRGSRLEASVAVWPGFL